MGKPAILLLILVILASGTTLPQISVKAIPKTIIVPDDYPTITEAINNAYNGDTILFREGIHEGPINQTIAINKTLSIIGENNKATIKLYPAYNETWILTTPFYSYSNAMAITANDCKLLSLTVVVYPGGDISVTGNRTQIIGNNITRGYASGISVQGAYCQITDNIGSGPIRLNGSYCEVARNTPYSINIEGTFNIIRDNICQGLSLSYAKNNILSENKVTTDSRSYEGIHFYHSHCNLIYKNLVKGFGFGVDLWLSANNTIVANTIIDCDNGCFALGGAFNNKIYLNIMKNNNWWDRYYYDFYSDPWIRDGNPDMKISSNSWDNGFVGNYWGDYNGTDSNMDGIGDSPYTINIVIRYFGNDIDNVICGRDNFPLINQINIYSVAVAQPDWASLTFPLEPFTDIFSPENFTTYKAVSVPLNFRLADWILGLQYSLDGNYNVTLKGNTTLSGLTNGYHTLTLFGEDSFGNIFNLAMVHFTVEVSEPFPALLVASVFGVSVAIGGVGLLVYFKKRK